MSYVVGILLLGYFVVIVLTTPWRLPRRDYHAKHPLRVKPEPTPTMEEKTYEPIELVPAA